MTHYMELLATNQPWNLILFMAIPVILAETVAITELVILFRGSKHGSVWMLNRFAWIAGGFYFLGVFSYLVVTAFMPITMSGTWRGVGDFIAVTSYLLWVIPLMGMALIDMNILARWRDEKSKLQLHATFVGIFLVVAHIAMIFGMINPSVFGYNSQPMEMNTSGMSDMPGMNH